MTTHEESLKKLRNQFLLSPWQKWKLFRKFPFKAVVHLLLASLVTAMCLLFAQYRNPISWSQRSAFATLFMPANVLSPDDTGLGAYSANIVRIEDFVMHVRNVVHVYENLNSISPDLYVLKGESVRMVFQLLSETSVGDVSYGVPYNRERTSVVYDLSSANLGPFGNNESLGQFKSALLNRMVDATISFRVQATNLLPALARCLEWKVDIYYDFSQRGGTIEAFLDPDLAFCSGKDPVMDAMIRVPSFWLAVTTILLSLMSVFLSLRRFLHVLYVKKSFPFARWRLVLNLVDYWTVYATFTAMFSVVSAVVYVEAIGYAFKEDLTIAWMMGMSSLLQWVNMVRYFEFSPKLYLLILTLRNGMPGLLRFVIGVAPIFVGYAVLGTIVFGSYSLHFRTIDTSFITLFSVLNGDSVLQIFQNVFQRNVLMAIFSRVFLFSFACLFIYAVLNIFIQIMEEGFFTAKENPNPNPRNERTLAAIASMALSQNGPQSAVDSEESRLVNNTPSTSLYRNHRGSAYGALPTTPASPTSGAPATSGFSIPTSAFTQSFLQPPSSESRAPVDDFLRIMADVQLQIRTARYASGISPDDMFNIDMMKHIGERLLSKWASRVGDIPPVDLDQNFPPPS
eukprot:ANDGO_04210.mRNA.1 hypothetical protein